MRFNSLSNVVGIVLALAFTATVSAQRQSSTDDAGTLETMPSIIVSTGATVIIPSGISQAPGPVLPSSTDSVTTNATGTTGTSVTTTATNSTSTGSNPTGSHTSSSSTSTTTRGAGVRSFDSTGIIIAGILAFTGAGALLQF